MRRDEPPQTLVQAFLASVWKLRPPFRIGIVLLLLLLMAAAGLFTLLPERTKEAAVTKIIPASVPFSPPSAKPVKQETSSQAQQTQEIASSEVVAQQVATVSSLATPSDHTRVQRDKPTDNPIDGVTREPNSIATDTVPSLTVNGIPSKNGGSISGRAVGLSDNTRFGIVVYARTDKWYVQPDTDQAIVNIQDDGTWKSWTRRGSEFLVLLVRRDYQPAVAPDAPPVAGASVVTFEIVTAVDEARHR